jgi:hypothetical protein
VLHPAHQLAHPGRVGERGEDHELVATDPVQGVRLAQRRLDRRHQGGQCRVSGAVAVRVVDLLQPVEVDSHHSQVELALAGARHGAAQVVGQRPSVGASSERVGPSRYLQGARRGVDGLQHELVEHQVELWRWRGMGVAAHQDLA